MTNIDRAAEVLADWVLPGVPPEVVAQALADAGLLTPEPQIIRTRDELAALDPDTILINIDVPWCELRIDARAWMDECDYDAEGIFPIAVISTGDQVRAARQALGTANDKNNH